MKKLKHSILILTTVMCSCKEQIQSTINQENLPIDCFSQAERYKPTYDLTRFEAEVSYLEKVDILNGNTNVKNSIIFYGSSSFAFWNADIPNDFKGLPAIGHGFGGSTFPELIYYKQRLLINYKPKTILIYCENDLVNPPTKSVEEVFVDACYLINDLHSLLPDTKIFILPLKHSPARRSLIPKYDKINNLLKASVVGKKYLSFIDINPAMYKSDQKTLDGSIFKSDSLHMNRKGYERWISIIKPILEADYKSR